jgi:tRNA G18 (ribose-2'-O)-methylase SpoU
MKKLKLEDLGRISVEEFKETKKIPVVVILDDVRSAYNVGSVFRTADAFLIQKIYLCGITGTPPNREIRKTALGADESVEWEYVKDIIPLIHALKSDYYKMISIEQTDGSISLPEFKINPDEKYVLIFGNEVEGVNQQSVDLSDYCIEIPQEGTKHSLNVSVCAGIVMWEFFRKTDLTD